jgi:diguanylate cyclase (GGDEF)-like protein
MRRPIAIDEMPMNPSKRQREARPNFLSRHCVLSRPVLVVEDQRALAMMLAAMLKERWGCEVHVAEDFRRAKELLASGAPYFAACCDLNLPDAPDGEVIDILVAADIPIIAVTAAFGGEMRQRMIDKGVLDYVLKNSVNAYAHVCELVGFIARNQLAKALVIDDDPLIRDMLMRILTRLRMIVLTAENADDALLMVEDHPDVRLAIVHEHVPQVNGVVVTSALRQRLDKEHLVIIGISDSDDRLIGADFLKNGANDFIRKPFVFEEMITRITKNLEMLNLVEENRQAAYRDYLTGLPNRRSFFVEGPAYMKRASVAGRPLVVAMVDIDNFKRINDTHGHDVGDVALQHVAGVLSASFPDCLVGRLGGEEFGIVLPGSGGEARAVLEKFLATLVATPLVIGQAELTITASIGLATLSRGVEPDLDDLLKAADARLYVAKSLGRNRVEA